MPQDVTTQIINLEQSEYMTFLAVQQQGGIIMKYLASLGIKPNCFHIGMCSLSISREAMARVKQFKQNPALLVHLKSSVAPQARG